MMSAFISFLVSRCGGALSVSGQSVALSHRPTFWPFFGPLLAHGVLFSSKALVVCIVFFMWIDVGMRGLREMAGRNGCEGKAGEQIFLGVVSRGKRTQIGDR